jgi:hypothetical protein
MSGLDEQANANSAATDGGANLSRFLLYTVSLPERVVRSTVGVAAGAAREAAGVLVPQAFQSSKTYELVVVNSMRFLTEDVGGVQRQNAIEQHGASDDFLARKAVGNFVDLAGMATLHVSPIWVFAIVSDLAYGSKTYLRELAAELHQQGLIAEVSTIDRVDDLLEAVRSASSETASLFDTPPLSVDQLKATLDRTRAAVTSADYSAVLPEAELNAYWNEMRSIAGREGVSLLGVSGALTMHTLTKLGTVTQGALTGVQVAGGLMNRHVVQHYTDALVTLRQKGFYPLLRESSAPYIQAVWRNFGSERETWTSALVSGRLFYRVWVALVRRLRRRPPQEGTKTTGEEIPDRQA